MVLRCRCDFFSIENAAMCKLHTIFTFLLLLLCLSLKKIRFSQLRKIMPHFHRCDSLGNHCGFCRSCENQSDTFHQHRLDTRKWRHNSFDNKNEKKLRNEFQTNVFDERTNYLCGSGEVSRTRLDFFRNWKLPVIVRDWIHLFSHFIFYARTL